MGEHREVKEVDMGTPLPAPESGLKYYMRNVGRSDITKTLTKYFPEGNPIIVRHKVWAGSYWAEVQAKRTKIVLYGHRSDEQLPIQKGDAYHSLHDLYRRISQIKEMRIRGGWFNARILDVKFFSHFSPYAGDLEIISFSGRRRGDFWKWLRDLF